ncbi:MAG: membrane-bound lytic murein transglycosylase MltF [Rhodocyclales bacterium]|nr:membrane-bound lytic murein transglycosylase MltF [Rhodocyclales bacterium]
MLPHFHLLHFSSHLAVKLKRAALVGGGALLAATLIFVAWTRYSAPLAPPAETGELVVATLVAPGLFARDESGVETGADHDLASEFAASLGVKARFIIAADAWELMGLVESGQAHMAVSAPLGSGELKFSTPVRSVSQWIVGRDDTLGPNELSDLAGRRVEVVAGSPLADTLRGLDQQAQPQIIEMPDADETRLLTRIAERNSDLAATHEISLDLASQFHPELTRRLRLPGNIEFGWAFARGNDALRAQADAFLSGARKSGLLARIDDRYFGHVERIDANSSLQLIEDIKTRLPALRRHFHAAQELTGIDWRLIAALAYQESHWDPLATSATNVRGIMMLTEDTADHLGVRNRLDAAESIRAGARYLAELAAQLPASAKPPDRIWLALAAYNLGMGHFRGAQAIARSIKRDPDNWYEMKKVLPLLSRPDIAERLKSGPARGGEAVILVENVHTYYDILSHFEAPHSTPFPRPLMQQ